MDAYVAQGAIGLAFDGPTGENGGRGEGGKGGILSPIGRRKGLYAFPFLYLLNSHIFLRVD